MNRPTILLVEDDLPVREVFAELFNDSGYRAVKASSAEEALQVLHVMTPDLIVIDVGLGAMSGIELCAQIKRTPRHEFTPVVILTALSDDGMREAGQVAGADDVLFKPVDFVQLHTRVAALLRVKSLVGQLEQAEGMITTVAATFEARDRYTVGHSARVARYAVAVGRALGLDAATVWAFRLGAGLHDVGKITLPDRVLLKPGRLDPQERQLIEAHPVVGAELVRGLGTLDIVRPFIRHHHERWNGSGYPDGLKGDAIPLGARIIAVVDVYDALRVARPYAPAQPHDAALSVLRREADAGLLDPTIVEMFSDALPDVDAEITTRRR